MRMREIGVPLIEEVPDYEVRNGLVHVRVGGVCLACFPVRVFEVGIARSAEVIAKWRVAELEKVKAFGPIRRQAKH